MPIIYHWEGMGGRREGKEGRSPDFTLITTNTSIIYQQHQAVACLNLEGPLWEGLNMKFAAQNDWRVKYLSMYPSIDWNLFDKITSFWNCKQIPRNVGLESFTD